MWTVADDERIVPLALRVKLHMMVKKVNDDEDGCTWGKDVISGTNGLFVGINVSAKFIDTGSSGFSNGNNIDLVLQCFGNVFP